MDSDDYLKKIESNNFIHTKTTRKKPSVPWSKYNVSSYIYIIKIKKIVLITSRQTKPVIDNFHVALHVLSIKSQQLIHSIA